MRKKSIKYKLIFQILMILVPLLSSVIFNSFYMVRVLRGQAFSSSRDVVKLYQRQVDLSLADNYLLLVAQSHDTVQLAGLKNGDNVQRLFGNINLFNNFRDLLNLYPTIDIIFAYTAEYNEIISASSEEVFYFERKMLWNYIESLPVNGDAVDANWTMVQLNENKYLFNIKSFDGGFLGIVTKPQTLKTFLFQNDADTDRLIFADNDGNALTDVEMVLEQQLDLSGDLSNYYLTGNTQPRMIVGTGSSVADFRLLMAIPDSEIIQSVSWVHTQSSIIIAVSLAAFAAIITSIFRGVLRPIDHIIDRIRGIERGEVAISASPRDEAREYMAIYTALNNMLIQIEALKIDKYEEYIKRQQSELHFYQMQIKPHFILGCLSTISNLAQLDEKKKMIEFISNFSHFSRYLFHTEFTMMTLKDELLQIEHYINMQRIRYPDHIFIMTDIADDCYSRQIPAMILQTLVENCVKHGMDSNNGICILIQSRTSCSNTNEDKSLMLVVEDNGAGFPQELLAEINNPSFVTEQWRGFGLREVKATLELNYNGRARISFKNIEPKGARVEIILP